MYIQLTDADSNNNLPIWVNPEHIVGFYRSPSAAVTTLEVFIGGSAGIRQVGVAETPDQILAAPAQGS